MSFPPTGWLRCVAVYGSEILTGSRGSGLDEHPLGFIAEKLPLRFRFLKAAICHWVLATRCRHSLSP